MGRAPARFDLSGARVQRFEFERSFDRSSRQARSNDFTIVKCSSNVLLVSIIPRTRLLIAGALCYKHCHSLYHNHLEVMGKWSSRSPSRRAGKRSFIGLMLLFTFAALQIATIHPTTVYRNLFLDDDYSFSNYSHHKRRLEFVHIPKTGGTVIESVAAKGGVPWTICHFLPPSDVASMSMNIIQCPNYGDKGHFKWRKVRSFHGLVWWHLPPSYFFNYSNELPANPYQGADIFAVVRNPYDRLISEYYYQQSWLVSEGDRAKTQNVRHFNEWVAAKLTAYSHFHCQRSAKFDLFQTTNATQAYLSFDGHLISQYDYIYDGSSSSASSHSRRIVDHVLKFENLTAEYDELMAMYGLRHLTPLPREHVRKSLPKSLGLYNLTLDNLQRIEKVYQQDFEEFGYEPQSAKIPWDILQRNQHLVKCKSNLTWYQTTDDTEDGSQSGGWGSTDYESSSLDRPNEDEGFEILGVFTPK